MMRCRPGTPVFQTEEATGVQHLRCTAHALHRVREMRESNLHVPRRLSGPTTSAVCFVRRRRGMPVPARGEIDAAALTQIEDAEITRLVARQEAIGLKSITDGEFMASSAAPRGRRISFRHSTASRRSSATRNSRRLGVVKSRGRMNPRTATPRFGARLPLQGSGAAPGTGSEPESACRAPPRAPSIPEGQASA